MARDQQARDDIAMTLIAVANLVGTIVSVLQDLAVTPQTIHHFIDRFAEMNAGALEGEPAALMRDLVEALRQAMAAND